MSVNVDALCHGKTFDSVALPSHLDVRVCVNQAEVFLCRSTAEELCNEWVELR